MVETLRLLTPVVRVHEGKKPASRWAEYERRGTRRIFAGKEKVGDFLADLSAVVRIILKCFFHKRVMKVHIKNV